MGIGGRRKEVKRFTVVAGSLESYFIQIKMLLPKRSRGHLKLVSLTGAISFQQGSILGVYFRMNEKI